MVEALPWDQTPRDKSDFNDALRELGRSMSGIAYTGARIGSPSSSGAVGLVQAQHQLIRAMRQAEERLLGWAPSEDAPPALGLKVGLGLGKTEQALKLAVRCASRGTVVYAVPTHKLGAELFIRLEKELALQGANQIRVAIWRGREAEDPDAPGQLMCRKPSAVREVQKVGLDLQETVCSRKLGTVLHQCEHFSACPYQRQRQTRADIWLVPHSALFTENRSRSASPRCWSSTRTSRALDFEASGKASAPHHLGADRRLPESRHANGQQRLATSIALATELGPLARN